MQGKTILIADDEMHVTHILSFKFEQVGATVIIATDGEEAYKLACEHKPDVIITDNQMPVMSGFEMSIKLRENSETAHIPVVMLTARGHKLAASDLTHTNIRHVVPKPFSAIELLAKVKELIAGQDGCKSNDTTDGDCGTNAA